MRPTQLQQIQSLERDRECLENEIGRLANWLLLCAPAYMQDRTVVDAVLVILTEWAIGVGLDSRQSGVRC